MGLETIDNTDTTTSRYLHLLETWNEQNRGSIEEGISSAFVESLPKGAKSIKVRFGNSFFSYCTIWETPGL